MKKTLTALAILALLPAGAALADSDECRAPRDSRQSHEAVMELARKSGWTVKEFEIDDGCYEIEGRDGQGREFEARLDPATLKIVELEYEDDGNRRRGAGDGAPSQDSRPGTTGPGN